MSQGIDRAVAGAAAVRLLAPSVRRGILEDSSFARSLNLSSDAVVSIGRSEHAFRRTKLFGAIRNLLTKSADATDVADEEGQIWKLRIENDKLKDLLVLLLGENRIVLPESLFILSDDQGARVRAFQSDDERFFVSEGYESNWSGTLRESSLSDDQMSDYLEDVSRTPAWVYGQIVQSMRSGSTKTSILVPRAPIYYERLIGQCGDCDTLEVWISERDPVYRSQLLRWSSVEGLKRMLARSFHPKLVPDYDHLEIETDDLETVYTWLIEDGDIISQVGAIEAALRSEERLSSLEKFLPALLDEAFAPDEDVSKARYEFFSSTFIFVDSELARLGLFSSVPAFWRRCASLSQVAQIERAAREASVSTNEFTSFGIKEGSQLFWLRTHLDLRTAPHWHSELASPEQLKQECLGRVLVAASGVTQRLRNVTLRRELKDKEKSRLWRELDFVRSIYPGPLEGRIEALLPIPSDLLESISAELEKKDQSLKALIGIINSGPIYDLPSDIIRLTIKALRAQHSLIDSEGDAKLLGSVLVGLANVAAIKRSKELAEEVLGILRRYRAASPDLVNIQETISIGLSASAAWPNRREWAKNVCRFFTELSFTDISKEDAKWVYTSLDWILTMEPSLWRDCGRAKAASRSVWRS